MATSGVTSVGLPRVRFTLAQLLLLVALLAILISLVIFLFANQGRINRSVSTIVFLPDGNQLAVATYSWRDINARNMAIRGTDIQRTVEILDLTSGKRRLISTGAMDHLELVAVRDLTTGPCLACSPQGHLAVANWKGPVDVYDLESGKVLTTFGDASVPSFRSFPRGSYTGYTSVAYSPDGKRLVSARFQTAEIRDLATGKTTPISRDGEVSALALSSDALVVTGDSVGRLKLWDAATGAQLQSLRNQIDPAGVFAVAFSPDGRTVAAGYYSDDGARVQTWRVSDGSAEESLEVYACSLAFSPDGRRMAVVSRWSDITIWDRETKRMQQVRDEFGTQFVSVAYSPDGSRFATGDTVGHVHFWDAERLRKVATYEVGAPTSREFVHAFVILAALPAWVIAWVVVSRKRRKRIRHERIRPGIRKT